MRGIGEEQWLGGTLAEMLCRFGVECAMVVSTLILPPLSIIFGRYLTPAFTFTLAVIFRLHLILFLFAINLCGYHVRLLLPRMLMRLEVFFIEMEVEKLFDIKSVMRGTGEDTVAWRYFYRDVVPFAAMFAVECSTVGTNTLYKAASLRGLNSYVFIFYSYAASTIVLLPLVLIFGRSKKLPSAKSPLFFKMFLLGLFGCTARMVGFKGVEQSFPTLSSAMSNLTPAFTFTLADEQVVLRSSATQAKIIGGVLSISGALFAHQQLTSSESSWIVGGILLASQYFFVSVWYIVQTLVMEVYPEEITVVFFYNLFATLVSAPICLLAERNLTSWVLKPDITLAAIIYSGVFASVFSVLTHTHGVCI
ncbi:BnaC04g32220D [Brassica napus]|uniref:WAT1-related protein n=1 Tax=Brassica napus TaxID=3708 RepID=A0A078HHE9_BRANA|nr:BnaC04g32220D [Brassica napus]